MNKKIGPFKLYEKEPNDICYGHIYTWEANLPVPFQKRRTIRVYLPEDYDENKKYPVMYMSDGQNIVDKYTSAYGAWEIDKRQHELLLEGFPSFIVVGIDCPVDPKHRVMEYSFPGLIVQQRYAGKKVDRNKIEPYSISLYKYIVETLKPLIDQLFATDVDNTACGGSSMGGVFSLSLATSYPDIFKYALCFSPAYHLYYHDEVIKYLNSRISDISKNNKFYFYSGAVDFEKYFIAPAKMAKDYFLNNGFSDNNIGFLIDETGLHNEETWSKHFNEAIKFWLK